MVVVLVVLCLLLSLGCLTKRDKYRYLYPDGYIGWTRIYFSQGAPMPPIEDGAYIFKFTPTGELNISTDFKNIGGDYPIKEYYYYTEDLQYTEIWPTSAGSVNTRTKEDREKQESQSLHFVGTDDDYRMYKDRFLDKNGNQIIGLVKRTELQKQ